MLIPTSNVVTFGVPPRAPVLFTQKKTGEIWLCVDFCGLNTITCKNRYPIPLVNNLLDCVQGCKVFSVIGY
jgi:hypothetical protein